MHLNDVVRLAAMGEGLCIEFKKKVPTAERLSKEAIALANTEGGYILVGVEDNGQVTGVRDALEEEYVARGALDAHCDPLLHYTTERVRVTPKREVLVINIPKSDRRPHFLRDEQGQRGVAYVRVDASSIEASREAVRLLRLREQEERVTFQFGHKEQLLMRYLDQYGRITVTQFAEMAGIPTRNASQTLVLLTRANVLRLHYDTRADFFTLVAPTEPARPALPKART